MKQLILASLVVIALPTGGQAATAAAAGSDADSKAAHDGELIYQGHCAQCHEGGVAKAPHRDMMHLMTPERVMAALTSGVMQEMAAPLTGAERQALADYLGKAEPGSSSARVPPKCAGPKQEAPLSAGATVRHWGAQPTNRRDFPTNEFAPEALTLRWAFAFPDANRARSQPLVAFDTVYVGSHSGRVYALDFATGCVRWTYDASGEVRTGFTLSGAEQGEPLLFFGDLFGHVYALQARNGELAWKVRVDEHPNATITAAPSAFEGRLYVSVSSLEVNLGFDPKYECCTFRGSVVALDQRTGKQRWKTYTIPQESEIQYYSRVGTAMYGPSGAAIWNSPAIDAMRRQLTVGTAENASSPATPTSDAIIAMDLDDGSINWVFQGTFNDAWNTGCDAPEDASCPPEDGPDFDFGAATLLATTPKGRDLVLGGQKSGVVYALDPDDGSLVWQQRAGRGGIQGGIHFGMAADATAVYVPVSDWPDGRSYPDPARPGLHALALEDGQPLWYAPGDAKACQDRPFCHHGISQAISVAGGMVLAGAMDGVLRIHDRRSGEVVWQVDTTVPVPAIDSGEARGGSFGGAAGPVVAGNRVLLSSGYGIYGHMPGAALLVFEPARSTQKAAPADNRAGDMSATGGQ